MKNKPEYANLRIAHGKDRCANPPRSGPQGGSGVKRVASGHSGQGQGHGQGHVNGNPGVGGGVMEDDGEMQFMNGDVEEDEVLEALAEMGEGQGNEDGVGHIGGGGEGLGQEMHVDGKEPAAAL